MNTDIYSDIRYIPAKDLTISPLNVRKTGTGEGIEELASLILAEGILQNLNVHPLNDDDQAPFGVVAGGRRLRALQRLIKQKKLKPDHPVPCRVVSLDRALQISLTENSGRQAMHPADEFEAFRAMIDLGASIEEVAANFGVTPLVVQRRLKLANVAPALIAAYRDEKLSLDQLMAFAVCDDHARQLEVWKSLATWDQHPGSIRDRLTEGEISTQDPMARYVGITAYEKAGGIVRRDLFADEATGFVDAALILKLAGAKLEKQAAKLRAEGLAWVEVHPKLDYATRASFGRIATTARAPSEEEQSAIDKLEAQIDALQGGEDEETAEQEETRLQAWSKACEELETLREALDVPDPAQQALAGAVVSVGRDGRIEIVRDVLKPEDAAKVSRRGRPPASTGEDGGAAAASVAHSAALIRRLTAQRTLALQAEVAKRPDVALIAITHRLLLCSCYPYAFTDSAVKIQKQPLVLAQHQEELEGSQAQQALKAHRSIVEASVPKLPDELMDWLAARSQAELLSLLAFAVAETIDGVQSDEGQSDLDPLAKLAGLDMRRWWRPTAVTYLSSVPKARILEVVAAATSAETAAPLAKLTKGLLVQEAEKLLADSGWLPEIFRTPA